MDVTHIQGTLHTYNGRYTHTRDVTHIQWTLHTYNGRYTHTRDVTHIQGTLHTYMQQEAEEQRARDEADHAAALLAVRDQALEQGVYTHTHTHTHVCVCVCVCTYICKLHALEMKLKVRV
jgi:hypothetical protein